MTITFTTKGGSVYQIDNTAMAWALLIQGEDSKYVKDGCGRLLEWPRIEYGESAFMHVEPAPGTQVGFVRVISTQPVIRLEREEILNNE